MTSTRQRRPLRTPQRASGTEGHPGGGRAEDECASLETQPWSAVRGWGGGKEGLTGALGWFIRSTFSNSVQITEHRDPYSFYWQLDQLKRAEQEVPRPVPAADYVLEEEAEELMPEGQEQEEFPEVGEGGRARVVTFIN